MKQLRKLPEPIATAAASMLGGYFPDLVGNPRLLGEALQGFGLDDAGAGQQHKEGSAVTVAEAATRLSCCTQTIYRLIRSGDLPAIRLRPGARKGIRVPVTALLALDTRAADGAGA